MPEVLLGAIDFGGYINPVKLVIFLILFFLWVLLIKWVYEDARAVGTKEGFWTGLLVATGAAGILMWLLVPIFAVGAGLYITAVAVITISYLMHRDSKVMEYDRILTLDGVKKLFSSEKKEVKQVAGITFITANNNEVPTPEAKTGEFFGYKAAVDMFTDATRRRAENVIFTPAGDNYNVIYNVDGAPLKQPSIAHSQFEYFSRFIKSLADLNPDEKRKPQKGKFTVHKDNNIDWEITTAGSTEGEQIRLKQATKQSLMKLEDLSLTERQYETLSQLQHAKQGLFLVSGPRKSGATTTFYSLLRNHDAFINSVTTIERQPSSDLPNIPQEIYSLSDTGVTTYSKKLVSIVRRGPDIIGVGECLDSETAQVVCKTAAGGKLVYVVLDAESASRAAAKWIKLVGDKNLATGVLLGISNQRILRKLCTECRQAYEPNREILHKFNLPAEKVKVLYRAGKVIYNKRGKGRPCDNCQETGYVGRMGIFEVIKFDSELRQSLRVAKSVSDIEMLFRSAKMTSLQDHALKKVIDGTTAINEMVRVFSRSKSEKGG